MKTDAIPGNSGAAIFDETIISSRAEKVVEDAHGIAGKSGRNILEISKDMAKDIKQ